jgi:Co/Zn/Cd efflux system component
MPSAHRRYAEWTPDRSVAGDGRSDLTLRVSSSPFWPIGLIPSRDSGPVSACFAAPSDDDDELPSLTHVTPAYKRALWIVIVLNVGYGVVEMLGGFISGSQALKADALDFLGDGLISLIGLLAIGWSLAGRARSALTQGLFLGALGVAVFVNTIYRVFALNQPEAELMASSE